MVSAVAFSAGSFLFSKLNHPGYLAENKRHNHALEELAAAKEKFYENQVQRKNKLLQLQQALRDAKEDDVATNQALLALKKFRQSVKPEPQLSDYYSPSPEMKHYQTAAIATLGILGGLGIAGTASLLL